MFPESSSDTKLAWRVVLSRSLQCTRPQELITKMVAMSGFFLSDIINMQTWGKTRVSSCYWRKQHWPHVRAMWRWPPTAQDAFFRRSAPHPTSRSDRSAMLCNCICVLWGSKLGKWSGPLTETRRWFPKSVLTACFIISTASSSNRHSRTARYNTKSQAIIIPYDNIQSQALMILYYKASGNNHPIRQYTVTVSNHPILQYTVSGINDSIL
jgi:hypothetical protein